MYTYTKYLSNQLRSCTLLYYIRVKPKLFNPHHEANFQNTKLVYTVQPSETACAKYI